MNKNLLNSSFVDAVKNNNIENINAELVENIFRLLGDKIEIYKGVEYAKENSSFKFDVHEEMIIENINNLEKEFSAEKFNLYTNFSFQRYEKLIDLFPKVFVNTNIKNTMDLSIVDEQVVKNNSIVFKAIAAVIIISILTYTVAKCSSDSTEANKTSLINDSIQAR